MNTSTSLALLAAAAFAGCWADEYPVKLDVRGTAVAMNALPLPPGEVARCLETSLDSVGYPAHMLSDFRILWMRGPDLVSDDAPTKCQNWVDGEPYNTPFKKLFGWYSRTGTATVIYCPDQPVSETALVYEVVRRHLLQDLEPPPVSKDTQRRIDTARAACSKGG